MPDLDPIPAEPATAWAWSISAAAVAAAVPVGRQFRTLPTRARGCVQGRRSEGDRHGVAGRAERVVAMCVGRSARPAPTYVEARRAVRTAGVEPPAGNDKLQDAGRCSISVESPPREGGLWKSAGKAIRARCYGLASHGRLRRAARRCIGVCDARLVARGHAACAVVRPQGVAPLACARTPSRPKCRRAKLANTNEPLTHPTMGRPRRFETRSDL